MILAVDAAEALSTDNLLLVVLITTSTHRPARWHWRTAFTGGSFKVLDSAAIDVPPGIILSHPRFLEIYNKTPINSTCVPA